MSVWDNPELRASGDYVKFDTIGDSVTGTVTAIRAHRWDDGSVCPQILLVTDDGEERTVTAGQIRLKTALAEKRPEAGDHLTITLADVEKRSGGKTLKHFTVDVTPGTGNPFTDKPTTTPPADAAPAGAQPDPAALAAALGNLTPEQKAALGL